MNGEANGDWAAGVSSDNGNSVKGGSFRIVRWVWWEESIEVATSKEGRYSSTRGGKVG